MGKRSYIKKFIRVFRVFFSDIAVFLAVHVVVEDILVLVLVHKEQHKFTNR